jgi:hypothetical protein
MKRQHIVTIEIKAEEGFLTRLEGLAEESKCTKAEIIDRAVGLYEAALGNAKQGKEIKFAYPVNDSLSRTMKPTNHFEIKMSEEFAKEFEDLQLKTGLSATEVFRRAIAVYGLVKPASMAGERVLLVSKEIERELVSI